MSPFAALNFLNQLTKINKRSLEHLTQHLSSYARHADLKKHTTKRRRMCSGTQAIRRGDAGHSADLILFLLVCIFSCLHVLICYHTCCIFIAFVSIIHSSLNQIRLLNVYNLLDSLTLQNLTFISRC